jgi:hypothetical protein
MAAAVTTAPAVPTTSAAMAGENRRKWEQSHCDSQCECLDAETVSQIHRLTPLIESSDSYL